MAAAAIWSSPNTDPPSRELEVGGEDDRLCLVGLRHHLEEQPRALGVEGQEPQLVHDEEVRAPDPGELAVEPAVAVRPPEVHHQGRGGEEPRLAAYHAQRRGHMGLSGADVAHQDRVLLVLHERQGQQAVAPEPLRPRDDPQSYT